MAARPSRRADGTPNQWFTPGFAQTGMDWKKAAFSYANAQPAGTLWYHDHAMEMTRLNAYMGLAGFYLVTDPANEPVGLPSGAYDIGLAVQDKMFNRSGSLVYPDAGINPDHSTPSGCPRCSATSWSSTARPGPS